MKPDQLYLNEVQEGQAPVDDFKKDKKPIKKVKAVDFYPTEKPNQEPPKDP